MDKRLASPGGWKGRRLPPAARAKVDIRLLLRLTLPIFLELVMQLLVGNVDKIMVGNDISATAINQANSILDMLTVSLSVLSAASLILINQYKGAKDEKREGQIYLISFYFTLALGLAIGLCVSVLARPIFAAMQVPPQVLDEALVYIRITGSFLFLQAVMLSLGAYLRSNTFMMQSLAVSFVFNLLNIGGNALFLYGLGIEGAMGVAIPSTIARALGVAMLAFAVGKSLKIDLRPRRLKGLEGRELKKLLHIGLPSCGESISYSFSQIVILAVINLIGTSAAIAKTYATMLAMCSYLFTSAISQAMQILLGRALGANQKQAANDLVMFITRVSCLTSLAMSVLIALFAENIFGLLTRDPEVIALCKTVMFIDVALELGRAVNIVMVRALQTCGDVFFPTTLSILFCWCVAVLGAYLLGYQLRMGIAGVWLAMAVDEIARAFICLARFHKGGWRKLSLVENVGA